jgi:O-antigen ligase
VSDAVTSISNDASQLTLRGFDVSVRLAKQNPMQTLAAMVGIALVFLHMSNAPEFLFTVTGKNLYLLYVVGPFAYLAVLFTDGIRRTTQSKAALWFLLFALWMLMAFPFSHWRGGSYLLIKNWLMIVLPLLFVTIGLLVTWKQVMLTYYAIALSGVLVLVNTRLYGETQWGERLSLVSSGTLGNSNDLASHLVLVIPFFLFLMIDRNRNVLVRLFASGLIGYALLVILRTGSRGALVALVVGGIVALILAPMRIRLGLAVAGGVAVMALPIALPDTVKARFMSLIDDNYADAAAEGASDARQRHFLDSLMVTAKRPVFGVGPGQFGNFNGGTSVEQHGHGDWHQTHCSWTQISSECGIPALIFMLGAIGTMLRGVLMTYRRAIRHKHEQIARASLCFLLGAVTFLVSITFLSNAYRYYLPILIGLGTALAVTAAAEMNRKQQQILVSEQS